MVVAALLASFSIGYFLRDSSFDPGWRRDATGLSSGFRKKATPAYVSLTHMESLSSDDAGFLKEQFNAEKSLAEASPMIRTGADTEAYAFLKHWLAGATNEPNYGRLVDEHPNFSGALEFMAFYRQWHENCSAAASVYFEPPRQSADSKAEEFYKRDCMMEFPQYEQVKAARSK
jgi:hypothetical protein